jgi:putative transposase
MGFGADLFRTRDELLAENAALRQQLIVASRKVKKPQFRPLERGLLVVLASRFRTWREAVLLVKPDTVLRWHREGFRLLWKHKTRAKRPRQSRLEQTTIELIRSMARDNRTWGAERMRGELLKLGIRVSKRTIQRHILVVRPPGDGQNWKTFLANHTVWACDFLQVYDVWFRPLFAFFVVDVNTKEVVHVGVTREPNEAWTAQQLRQLTPFGQGPQFIIRDRDAKFGAAFDRVAEGAGIRVLKTAVRAPLMNATCERFLGSVRRECLDHIIVFGEQHLRSVLHEYVAYFNGARPHQGLNQKVPTAPSEESRAKNGRVIALPVLNGLHHNYRRAA